MTDLATLHNTYVTPNYAPFSLILVKGKGAWVEDIHGHRFLDCLSGYSALNQGHCHPHIVKALKRQLKELTLTTRAFHNVHLAPLAERLVKLSGLEMMLPMNTGAEGVESAIKIARRWGYQVKGVEPGKAEIIVCAENFHGRTTTIISFSTDPLAHDDFGPYTPGFVTIPFGDMQALKEAITPHTVGFLVEPIQGEAGVFVPPTGYLAAAQKVCRDNNLLLMLDEVQTGLGRTGKMFAFEHELSSPPDLLILGKALGAGMYPVSAVLGRRSVMSLLRPGSHGSTFAGSPLGAAVAHAALDVLEKEKLPEKAARRGEQLKEGLQRLVGHGILKEVRGRGLMVGLEIHKEAGPAKLYVKELAKKGVLTKESHEQMIRLAPALVITQAECDRILSACEKVFTKHA